jgi:hypothetical protein
LTPQTRQATICIDGDRLPGFPKISFVGSRLSFGQDYILSA